MPSEPQQLTVIPACLEDKKVKCLPSRAFYIADFISPEEEEYLLRRIETAPRPRWKQLSRRRLQIWPSELTKDTLLEAPLPQWLNEPVITRLLSMPVSSESKNEHIFEKSPHAAPNHVLINEYAPGQGIMPHKDGSAYHPVVCTVSLGSSLCLEIFGTKDDGTTESEPRWRVLQEPRSLLITTGELYTDFLHGIAEVNEDVNLGSSTISNWDLLGSPSDFVSGLSARSKRTSLTYRDVIKVTKLGNKFAIFGKH